MTTIAKIDTLYMTKPAKNHTFWDRNTYIAHVRRSAPRELEIKS